MFDSLTTSFTSAIKKIKFYDSETALKKALNELKKSLLKSDVHHKVVKDLLADVESKVKEDGIGQESFLKALKFHLNQILEVKGNQGFVFASKPPTVILMAGLQGSGKTTTVGKLATYLKLRKKKVLIAGADLQRMAAVEQLKQISEKIEVPLYADENEKDPVKIATEAFKKAEKELYDVLIVDTAGRLAIDDDLMDQLKNIKSAIKVDEVFYVADSLTGQDAVRTALTFNEKIGLDGVILSKYDGDSKGGVAISLAKQVGVPLRFIGLGEKMEDLEVFIPERIVGRLIGEGDIKSLMEKSSLVIDNQKAKKLNKKIKKGEFNFNDFLEQLDAFKKIGSLKSIIGMIPGMSQFSGAIKDMDFDNSNEMKQIRALIGSMTQKEKEQPSLLNPSRKRRLAKGSGLTEPQVNKILKQFKNASKMAKKFSGKKNPMNELTKMMKNNPNLGGAGAGGMPPMGGIPKFR
jgi:signal recognition particle subunit SRP54